MLNKITKEQQIKELVNRVPPILNVDIVIVKEGKYLIGRRRAGLPMHVGGRWLFPGGRMKYTETPQETALRISENEAPGVKAQLKTLITAIADKGWDKRSNGVTLYYLFNYLGGEPRPNEQLDRFSWVTKDEFMSFPRIYPLEKKIIGEVDRAVKLMNSTEDEILTEVDFKDKDVGSILKRDAHGDNKRYHRAAHIMIFNSRGQVVLHQRGFNKVRYPGAWDMFGGHQIYGMTIQQTAESELLEEAGIKTDLTLKKSGLYKGSAEAEFYYLFYGIHDGPYRFDKHEVEKVKAFDCRDLLNSNNKNKDYYILDHVFSYIKELKKVWEPLTVRAKRAR